jgi:hypothetical protein
MMSKDLKLAWAKRQEIQKRQRRFGAETGALYTIFANNGSGKLCFSAIIKMLRGTC